MVVITHAQRTSDDRTDTIHKDAPAATSRWGSADFRRWGIRPKLIAVVLIPTVAALLLGGLRMESALAASADYTRQESLAKALPELDAATQAIQAERDLTAGLIASSPPGPTASLSQPRSGTDEAVAALRPALVKVDASHNRDLQAQLQDLISQLDALPGLRRAAAATGADPVQVATAYTKVVQALNAVAGQLATRSTNGEVTRRAAGLQSLNAAIEAMSQQRGIVYRALQAKNLTGNDYTELAAANAASQLGITGYLNAASSAGRTQYQNSAASDQSTMISAVLRRIDSTRSVTDPAITATQWLSLTGTRAQQLQQVQADQATGLTNRIHSLGQSARTGALVSAGLIYLILSFALLATLLVARSILRPLRALRSAALDVAYQRLPGTVRQLEDSEVDAGALSINPIGVAGPDEIGQVARAFDAVHGEAIRLAGQQALMRGNVSKMFTNLSRRSQNLVERQLRLIDELEAGEQDADQLANLFRLDHLATRMRRNDENLLVLAGAEGGRRRSEPVPMLDVLRAASAEVEQYARVKLQAQTGYLLTGSAVNDVVHLVAELVENATTFSSPSTSVWVRSRGLGTGGDVMIEVEDHGIGMSPSELAAANQKLATPSGMDVSMSQLMGLFVVGRLAIRHGIEVQLRPAQTGGLIALVRLPAGLITAPIEQVPPSPEVQAAGAQDLVGSPIFDALQSEWFTRRGADPMPPLAPIGLAPQPDAELPPSNWRSPGDDGWLAAASLATPSQPEAVTPAGLPVRVPGRNLIPGSAAPAPVTAGNGSNGRPAKLPRALSGYQRGIRLARGEDEQPDSDRGWPGGPDQPDRRDS